MTPILARAASASQSWLLREELRLRPRRKPQTPVGVVGSRLRLLGVGVVYVTVAMLSQGLMGPGGDSSVFAVAGNKLLSRGWADTFANAQVQSGPVFLLLHGLDLRLTAWWGVPVWFGGGLFTSLACATLTVLAARSVFRRYGQSAPAVAARELAVGMVFALSGALWLVAIYAHPDDVIVAALLVLAAAASSAGRPGRAGTWFALAVGVKLWAVVAVAVLLLRVSKAGTAKAVSAAAIAVTVIYAPFFLFGHVNTFRWVWQVEDPAPLNLILRTDSNFTWPLRLLQASFASAMGMLALRGTWGRPRAVWLVPAVAIAGRLLMDPRGLVYYYPPLLLCLLLGQWAGDSLTVLGTSLTSMTWMVLAIAIFIVATHTVGSLWVGACCLAVIVAGSGLRKAQLSTS